MNIQREVSKGLQPLVEEYHGNPMGYNPLLKYPVKSKKYMILFFYDKTSKLITYFN